jgi:hypothetical protein
MDWPESGVTDLSLSWQGHVEVIASIWLVGVEEGSWTRGFCWARGGEATAKQVDLKEGEAKRGTCVHLDRNL